MAGRTARQATAPAPAAVPGAVVLRVRGAGKSFAGTAALSGVDLDLRAGEMLALVGANGAGKSTLVKLICGAYQPDAGTIEVGGRAVQLRSVADALAAGIAVAHQQVAVIRPLSAAENIMLGREPRRLGLIDERALLAEARALADRFGVRLDLTRECDRLDLGELKILDILKALASHPRVLILDEPTASLTLAETRLLFAFLRDLLARGLGILFISHHMREVFAECDRVVVLKDGRKVHDGATAETTLPAVVRLMVGREIEQTDWSSHAHLGGDVALSVADLQVGRLRVDALTVRRGEVVGIAGVLGAGQTALLECLAGARVADRVGSARLLGLGRLPRRVGEAVEHGIFLVADDRLRKSVLRGLSVAENVVAGSLRQNSRFGFMRARATAATVHAITSSLRIKCSGPGQDVLQLSGGNQQKVVFGRWIARIDHNAGGASDGRAGPLLLLDNPTEGVDVGSKAELYALVRDLAGRGASVLLASAEMAELTALCDRVYCISGGEVVSCIGREDLSEDRLLLEVN